MLWFSHAYHQRQLGWVSGQVLYGHLTRFCFVQESSTETITPLPKKSKNRRGGRSTSADLCIKWMCTFMLWWFRSAFQKHSYEDSNPDCANKCRDKAAMEYRLVCLHSTRLPTREKTGTVGYIAIRHLWNFRGMNLIDWVLFNCNHRWLCMEKWSIVIQLLI